jgi:4'-phosphopantetheinyl transferase
LSLDTPAWPSEELHALLDAEESARAARFRFAQHQMRFAHGRGLLRRVLAHATGVDAAALRFEVGEQGKPRLHTTMAPPTLDFNLSHSGAWALIGLSDGADIGVDIEVAHPVPDWAAIAARFFAAGEQAAMDALPPPLQEDAFLACWTRKEAFVKALGGGLTVALDSFEVSVDPRHPAQLLRSSDPEHPAADFYLWADRPAPDTWAAAVVRRPEVTLTTYRL